MPARAEVNQSELVSLCEIKTSETVSRDTPTFSIDLRKPSRFDPQKLDEFASRIINGNGEKRVRLHWIATEDKLFVFPSEIGHARIYRTIEVNGNGNLQGAGQLELRQRWDGNFWRYIYGHAESLNLVLRPEQSNSFRHDLAQRLNGHFIPFSPPGSF